MTVYLIVTALTGFQVINLVSYFAKILPQLLVLYNSRRFCSGCVHLLNGGGRLPVGSGQQLGCGGLLRGGGRYLHVDGRQQLGCGGLLCGGACICLMAVGTCVVAADVCLVAAGACTLTAGNSLVVADFCVVVVCICLVAVDVCTLVADIFSVTADVCLMAAGPFTLMAGDSFLSKHTTRIANFSLLKTRAQGRDSNSGPDLPQAASPKDQTADHPRFPAIEPPKAEAEHNFLDDNISQTLETTSPNRRSDKLPNGNKEIPTISFMSLKSVLVVNQDSSPEENTGLKPAPMTMD
ncbi:hypothetical protein DSO57_1028934 [Entomophthora muscae]|uniref:Uncharacterized protein n=1 Tax=Entomophthora muscae TaxID=34485 RepID=A0ACC2UM19_9FUNG|nr:hypothetical protein DSO57_1028934 [Entomophthora muscae]